MPRTSTKKSRHARATENARALGILEVQVHVAGVTYQHKLIRCGKKRCNKWHGPYWYAFWKRGGRTCSRYVGKELPRAVREAAEALASRGRARSKNERF